MGYFFKKWTKFTSLGTSRDFGFSINRRIRMINATAFTVIVICSALCIQGFLSERYVPMTINLVRVLISILLIFLASKGKYRIAVSILIGSALITTIAFVFLVPYQTGSSLSFFVIYSLTFYFLDASKKIKLVFSITFLIGCFAFYHEYNVLPNRLPFINILSFGAISLLIFLVFSYYRKEAEVYRKKLERFNHKLKTQHAVISQQKEEISSQRDDIRKQNIALKRERKRLKETQSIAKIGSWEYDLKTGEAEWSEIAFDIMGIEKENRSLSADSYLKLLTPEDQVNMYEQQQKLIRKGIPYEIEVTHKRPDGGVVHLLLNANRLTKYGETTKVLGTMANITERKKNEERLKALNASKDMILGTVAHDLRNPIHGIQGMVDILKLQSKGDIAEQDSMVFSMIEKSCKRALSLINELLEISKLEDEDFELTTQETDINDFLGLELAVYLEEIRAKELEFVLDLSEQKLSVMLNADSFQRAISNLLSNAIKFTPRKGKITISTCQTGTKAVLKISDTGIGIPKELQSDLFEKFSKAGRVGLEGEKSTGLGMSIVRQIIHLHGGDIGFKSEEDVGTTFNISLPLNKL